MKDKCPCCGWDGLLFKGGKCKPCYWRTEKKKDGTNRRRKMITHKRVLQSNINRRITGNTSEAVTYLDNLLSAGESVLYTINKESIEGFRQNFFLHTGKKIIMESVIKNGKPSEFVVIISYEK